MSPTTLRGPERAAKSGTTKRAVMFLHGLGSDGNDLLGLADMLDLPDTHFLSPHAPFEFDMAPFGHQWFSLIDRSPESMLDGVMTAAPILNQYIDEQLARFSLMPPQFALVGFSQGSMMSLYTAPRRAEPLAGVVGLSGAMVGAAALATELRSRPPVCIIHGTQDDVVPFAAMGHAEETLKAVGVPDEAHARPGLVHGIDEQAMDFTTAFLKKAFGL